MTGHRRCAALVTLLCGCLGTASGAGGREPFRSAEVAIPDADPAAVVERIQREMSIRGFHALLGNGPRSQNELAFSRRERWLKKFSTIHPFGTVDAGFRVVRVGETTWVSARCSEGTSETRNGVDCTGALGFDSLLAGLRDSLARSRSPATLPGLGGRGGVTVLRLPGRFLGFAAGACWIAAGRPSRLAAVDLATHELRSIAPIPADAIAITTSERFAWVASYAPPSLAKVELASGSLVDSIRIEQPARGLARAAGAIWIADWRRNGLIRIDEGAGTLERIGLLPMVPQRVAIAGGAIWVSGWQDLFRVDPATRTRGRLIATGGAIQALCGDPHALFAGLTREVIRFDAKSGNSTARASIPGDLFALAAGGGHLWVRHAAGLTCLDSATLERLGEWLDPYLSQGELTCRDGSLWLAFDFPAAAMGLDVTSLLASGGPAPR